MSVFEYLNKINAGKPINMEAFRKALPSDVREDLYSYFVVEPYSARLSTVQFTSTSVADQLMYRFTPSDSRIEASLKGSSHDHGVEAGYLLMYTEDGNRYAPKVVVMAENQVYFDGASFKNQVLIIENEENFFHYRKMMQYASDCQGYEISLKNTDVVFAGGNRVTKQIIANWIRCTYSRVICALDYDLGGLLIYKNLRGVIPHAEFAKPSDCSVLAPYFTNEPESMPVLLRAMDLARNLGFQDLADTFQKTSRFMEQETLLSEEFTL